MFPSIYGKLLSYDWTMTSQPEHTHTRAHTCTLTLTSGHIYFSSYVRMHARVHIRMFCFVHNRTAHAQTNTHTHTWVRERACMYARVFVNVCVLDDPICDIVKWYCHVTNLQFGRFFEQYHPNSDCSRWQRRESVNESVNKVDDVLPVRSHATGVVDDQ